MSLIYRDVLASTFVQGIGLVINSSEDKLSGTWELGTPKGLSKTILNSEVVLFLRAISM